MANRKQASPQAEEQLSNHPLMRNAPQADKLLEAARQRKEDREFQVGELKQWKDCVNGVGSTPNGQLFLKSMIQYAGNLRPPTLSNPQKMLVNNIKAAFYLECVRPYLNPDIRKEVE